MAKPLSRWPKLALALATLAPASLSGAVWAADLLTPAPAAPPPVPVFVAPDYGRFTFIEENDAFSPYDATDRHYTQGALFTYLSPKLGADSWTTPLYNGIDSVLPLMQPGPDVKRKFDVVFGQSIFTPTHYLSFPLNPKDRPFAAWLYTGGSLLQETDGRMLENFEVLAGVVGPDALGEQVQTTFHDTVGVNNKQLSQTWKTQLHNEPALAISYERKWKIWQSNLFGFETDAIPEVGATVGNVFDYAEAGGMLRIGRNLGVDYGVPRIRPSLSGTSWFDADRMTSDWGYYLFGGVQARAVARNIFLDGNTFTDSRSVDKEPFVGDASVGASVFYKDIAKLDASFTIRSNEFTTQAGPDRYGSIALSVRF